MPLKSVSISGVFQVGETLAATELLPEGATATYAWRRVDADGVTQEISGATESSYKPTNEDVGYKLRVDATGTGDYTGVQSTTSTEFVYGDIDGASISLSTSNGLFVGTTLTAKVEPNFATAKYQWYRVDTEGKRTKISGATKAKYKATAADFGSWLEVTVEGTGYWLESVTVRSSDVVHGNLSSIKFSTNAPLLGQTLTTIAPSYATASYQWARVDKNGVATEIEGATGASYTPVQADFGYYLRVVATGTDLTNGTVKATTKTPTKIPLEGVKISTTKPQVETTLTVAGLLPAGATATYAWYRGDDRTTPLSTSDKYTVVLDDVNSTLTLVATGSGEYGGTVSATTEVVPKVKLATPKFDAASDATDSTVSVSWGAVENANGYQICYKLATEDAWTTANVSTGTSYQAIGLERNRKYEFVVKAPESEKHATSDNSETLEISTLSTELSGVSISGTLYVGETLTASALLPEGATASYVWYRGTDRSTPLATTAKYVVTLGDVNSMLTLVATGTGDYVGTVSAVTEVVPKVKLATPEFNTDLSASDSTITVSWNAVENASGYQIAFKLATSDEWTTETVATGTEYQATNLTRNREYQFVVAALGEGKFETSEDSLAYSVTTLRTNVTNVAVVGVAQVGETLTASGLLPVGATVQYVWKKGETTMFSGEGDEFATYTPTEAGYNWKVVAIGVGDYQGVVESASFSVMEAKSIVVTTNADMIDQYDGVVSLREAISVYSESGVVVTFDKSLRGERITFDGTQLEITKSLTIDASNLYDEVERTPGVTIDANERSRVFFVASDAENKPSVSLIGLNIIGGKTDLNGGGIYASNGTTVTATKTWIYDNSAKQGGGVYAEEDASVKLTDAKVSENEADERGGGIYANGAEITTTNTSVSGNSAEISGGGVYAGGDTTLTLKNTEVVQNAVGDSKPETEQSSVFRAAYDYYYVPPMVLATTADETDANNGGGIYADAGSTVTLANATVAGNSANNGGGISTSGALTMTNTIVATNVSDGSANSDIVADDEKITAKKVLSSYALTGDNYTYTAGEPLFTDAESGDYSLTSDSVACGKGDSSLTPTDDKGVPLTTDVNGNALSASFGMALGASQYHISLEKISIAPISGKLEIGTELTATGLLPSGATASYQWYRVDDDGKQTAIDGAVDKTYKATSADVGFYLLVKATGTGDYADTVASETAEKVTAQLTSVSISGTAEIGQTLTVVGLQPNGASAAYQWYRGEEAIQGATGSTYVVSIFDVGKALSVKATGVGDYWGVVSSSPTDAVPTATKVVIEPTVESFEQALKVAPEDGKITFAQSAEKQTITLDKTIVLSKTVTIDGTGANIVFDGAGKTRVFEVEAGAAPTLTNLTIQNGAADFGGAIENAGTLTLTDVTLTGNKATRAGGAIYNYGSGETTLINVTTTGNSATKNGGAIFNNTGATLNVQGGIFTGNSARNGGAFGNYGTANITGSTAANISSNTADLFGGAYFGCGSLTINGAATFSGNKVTETSSKGGAIYNDANGDLIGVVSITGNVGFTDNTAIKRGGAIMSYSTLNVTGATTFTNNNGGEYGGAIDAGDGCVATLDGTATFNNNGANFGGAIFSVGKLTFQSDGDYSFSGNKALSGGAIDACDGTLNLAGAFTFYSNEATGTYDEESTSAYDKTGVGGALVSAAKTSVAEGTSFTWGKDSDVNVAKRGNCVALDTANSELSPDKFNLEIGDDYTSFKVMRKTVASTAAALLPTTFATNAVSAKITIDGKTTTFDAQGVTPEELGLGAGSYETLI